MPSSAADHESPAVVLARVSLALSCQARRAPSDGEFVPRISFRNRIRCGSEDPITTRPSPGCCDLMTLKLGTHPCQLVLRMQSDPDPFRAVPSSCTSTHQKLASAIRVPETSSGRRSFDCALGPDLEANCNFKFHFEHVQIEKCSDAAATSECAAARLLQLHDRLKLTLRQV